MSTPTTHPPPSTTSTVTSDEGAPRPPSIEILTRIAMVRADRESLFDDDPPPSSRVRVVS